MTTQEDDLGVFDTDEPPFWLRKDLPISKNLCNADLSGKDLRNADLRDAYLRNANLFGATLSGADLCGAYLRGAKMMWCKLGHANLQNANLSYVNLSGSRLIRANLMGAEMFRTNLCGATMLGARRIKDTVENKELIYLTMGQYEARLWTTHMEIGCASYSYAYWFSSNLDLGPDHQEIWVSWRPIIKKICKKTGRFPARKI